MSPPPLNMAILLERLPGLDEMRLYSFLSGRSSLPMTTLPSQVEELKTFIDSILSSPTTDIPSRENQARSRYRDLKRLLTLVAQAEKTLCDSVIGLTRKIALTAIKSCPVLEHVGESTDPTNIFPELQPQTDRNIPTLLLKSCPQLRVINGIKITIDVQSRSPCC